MYLITVQSTHGCPQKWCLVTLSDHDVKSIRQYHYFRQTMSNDRLLFLVCRKSHNLVWGKWIFQSGSGLRQLLVQCASEVCLEFFFRIQIKKRTLSYEIIALI